MNDIKQLEERITQLTELVKTGSEAIKNMEVALKAAEEERDRLADQRRESKPKFERVEYKKQYFGVRVNSEIDYGTFTEIGDIVDNAHFRHNNYFHTKERAQEVADKINFLLKLERLHDTFCPDYVPDWNDYDKYKYTVFYDYRNRSYRIGSYEGVEYKANVYFATREIAQKVCDILNAELKEKENDT